MIKKLIAIVASTAIMCGLAACGSQDGAVTVTGYENASKISYVNLYEISETYSEDAVNEYLSDNEIESVVSMLSSVNQEEGTFDDIPDELYSYSLSCCTEEGSTVCEIFVFEDQVWMSDWAEDAYYSLSGRALENLLSDLENTYGVER